eukprot:TRINITY_DN14476_c0_g3_i1.p1 TRINITY_DN14476_c0_g3~~TRINITY_DN14476_c0_g3_i1.p1  ORF type:complete len:171 (+),score=10.30 TRINITY_DN14476_c0_g3_i1:66-515(+)
MYTSYKFFCHAANNQVLYRKSSNTLNLRILITIKLPHQLDNKKEFKKQKLMNRKKDQQFFLKMKAFQCNVGLPKDKIYTNFQQIIIHITSFVRTVLENTISKCQDQQKYSDYENRCYSIKIQNFGNPNKQVQNTLNNPNDFLSYFQKFE